MRTMSNMKRKKHKTADQILATEARLHPPEPILTMHNMPPAGRTRERKQERVIKENATQGKILTISDLPRRARIAREVTAATAKARGQQISHAPLGPKVFSDYVRDGAWRGRRCFIIGGGPSVKNVDLDLLRGELTIGINRAYELLSPSILYGVDGQMWGWVEQGKCGEESKRKFAEYKGYKVWMALHKLFPPDFHLIDVDDRGGYRIGSTKLLTFKNNSGYGAINLAAALGANPIYLLGFDMQGNKMGKQKWWHDGYPMDYGEDIYESYIREISRFAPVLKKAGFEVVNLNRKSALKCFTFGDYKKVTERKPAVPEGSIQVMERPGMITAVTPTGDRPLAFELCKHWMEQQTVKPDQWIVVDDGKVPMRSSPMMNYVRRAPQPSDPEHTLNLNLRTAIPHIKGEKIIIIEDDEYYAPKYIETLSKELDGHEVVGISRSKYYHLPTGGQAHHANTIHASLAQTSFRSSFLPALAHLTSHRIKHYIDICLWQKALAEQKGYLFVDEPSLYAGIKGLPGRPGIGIGHQESMYGGRRDTARDTLKKWVPKDWQVYLDIVNGVLTTENAGSYFPQITGITVCQNTKDFMERSYTSIRKFHPDMPIIIIDGSDKDDPCANYVRSLASPLTTVYSLGYNIGHGKGMCMGIDKARTPYALIFDSDIEMLKSPVDGMMAMVEPDTFGVGYTELTASDGFEWGAKSAAGEMHNKGEPMKMLHPYFQLLNIANYHRFHPYVHHGAPCYLTALDIHKQGLSDKIIKEFPGLGHSSGKGWVWEGKPREYIRHDPAGTRNVRVKKGLPETEGTWESK